MESAKLDEEKLREAACYGDLEAIKTLLKKGVNINSQHSINGWTALHWAAKRNQLDVAHCLLTNGADKTMESFAKETPADLSTSPAVLNLLGSPMTKEKPEESDKNEITPHYLAHLNSGYKVDLQEHSRISMPLPHGRDVVHKKELVFKLRIAYSTDIDFIEVEIDRSELNYQQFLAVCCSELGLNSKYVERLRKLPNTRLRKDRDIQRLQDFQEIEVVLVGSKPKLAIESDSPNIVGPALKNQNQTILY
ncbi:hypothetical protein DAPPUDRAFT_219955 [Daphnia pulex]|uniref:Uncharacterized protein n=1 Tax=Daphnia pulex TaxID=6669 RepID=E9FRR6_DAPPU|nr:ankyrin repeat domain-containing protein 40-like [Daphnia pulicaria]EFX89897.1 hypothetical protein DAPPUDRAFT_219955 [Daphnia pulex]|eukprot:EFX89897.1 hypothetical protein DAPPUDRAFT_219955 [Daphnia pulex]